MKPPGRIIPGGLYFGFRPHNTRFAQGFAADNLKAISVGRYPAAGMAGGLELAAHTRGRFARSLWTDRVIPHTPVVKVGFLHVGSHAPKHFRVLLLQFGCCRSLPRAANCSSPN
jgi:hypothetical protein